MSAFCERCDAHIDTDGEPVACIDCLRELRHWESESRARAIRAVVAAQWGVACVLHQTDACCDADAVCWMLGDLPTAEQIVDGVTI